jgi:hypothetical protein
MSYTQTPNLGLIKPTPNSDTGTWGFHLNSNADVLDGVLSTTPGSAGALFLPLAGGTVVGGTTFSGAGTALAVTNNATIGGTLGVTGAATFSGALSATLLVNATNDAAAATAGVAVGQLYRNGSQVMQRVA